MAPQRRRRPQAPQAAQSTTPVDMSQVRVETFYMDINDVLPYAYNARKNAKAVDAVANSIQNFGFIVPIVVDDENNLAAGHTRIEAAKKLGMHEVLAVRASHLTADQIDAFRLVDNKVSELADWDTDLLGPELARLQDTGLFNFTEFGWTQEQIDCLAEVVPDDCLDAAAVAPARERPEGHITERRAPQQVRLVLGEHVIFISTTQYRNWIDGLRRHHNYDQASIDADIKNRLGILD